MQSAIETLQQDLETRTAQYNAWTASINRGDRNLPIETIEKMEREIQETAEAIKILTKYNNK